MARLIFGGDLITGAAADEPCIITTVTDGTATGNTAGIIVAGKTLDPQARVRLVDGRLPTLFGPDDGTSTLYVQWGAVDDKGHAQAVTGGAEFVPPAPGAELPAPTTGDAGKSVVVNEAEDGYELGAPSGTSTAGALIVRKFPFTFATSGLVTGAALYTPTIGDILLDAWIEITTAWDGTTPLGDVGMLVDTDDMGWMSYSGQGPVDMTAADDENMLGTGLLAQNSFATITSWLPGSVSTGFIKRSFPAKVTAANPIKVVVSQDGTAVGASPASTQGAAVLYLVTATPVAP